MRHRDYKHCYLIAHLKNDFMCIGNHRHIAFSKRATVRISGKSALEKLSPKPKAQYVITQNNLQPFSLAATLSLSIHRPSQGLIALATPTQRANRESVSITWPRGINGHPLTSALDLRRVNRAVVKKSFFFFIFPWNFLIFRYSLDSTEPPLVISLKGVLTTGGIKK